jgi:hypothetical protein
VLHRPAQSQQVQGGQHTLQQQRRLRQSTYHPHTTPCSARPAPSHPSPDPPTFPTPVSRLDHYFELVQELPEGVLPEEDVHALVAELDQPELLEPLLSLRCKALQEAKRTSWSNGLGLVAGSSSGDYAALPGEEVRGCAARAFTRSNSSGSSRRNTGSAGGGGATGEGGGAGVGGAQARGDTRRLSV